MKDTFVFDELNNLSQASAQFHSGQIYGYIHFQKNFSNAFLKRLLQPVTVDQETMNQSSIEVKNNKYNIL